MSDRFFTQRAAERILQQLGRASGGTGERIVGKCALCPREFDPETEFKDELSKKEYRITGTCQPCQDKVFTEEE